MARRRSQEDQVHEPVLLDEVIQWLRPERGGTFVDCTLGLGGHAEAILTASNRSLVIGFDRDAEALTIACARLARFRDRLRAVHTNFIDIESVLAELGENKVSGVLADLGVSSLQLDKDERGFSFTTDAPLDMRMDIEQKETAANLVNRLTERELADLIFEYGEERGSRKIARAIVKERELGPLETAKHLADTVVRALNVPGHWRIHPATRTFQALRIAVNDELRSLERFIPTAISSLETSGRLAIISFHSLEDRVVKRAFKLESGRCICETRPPDFVQRPSRNDDPPDKLICTACGSRRRVEILTRKPVRPKSDEVSRNPRSRSALLRVCERL
jgi:16S rRNA (cytosine1402-N4)-methyltransferase